MSDKDNSPEYVGRSANADRPFLSINDASTLANELASWQKDLEREIETADRRSRSRINRLWAVWQQLIVIFLFICGALLILFSLGLSINTLLTVESGHRVDLAKWILETLLGAFVAGLLAFTMVKSFEKI